MKIESTPPFQDFDCYKVFHKKMDRWQVCIVNKHNKKNRRTILYSKFLMSVKMGYILPREMEVDHVDGDRKNDSIENLEIVTRGENQKRYNVKNPARVSVLICPNCGNEFQRFTKNIGFSKKNFCKRSCVGKFYRKLERESRLRSRA